MSVRYVLRRGKLADVIQANLKEAELCYTTDTHQVFVGTNGVPKDIMTVALSASIIPYIAQIEEYVSLAQAGADRAEGYAEILSGVGSLDSLTDVTITTPTDGQIMKYDNETSSWVNSPTATATDIGLGNVTNESKETMFTSPTFTGTVTAPTVIGDLTGTATKATGIIGSDTRYSDYAPSSYIGEGAGMSLDNTFSRGEFKSISTMGLSSYLTDSFCYVITHVPWSDISGGVPTQIAYGNGIPCYRVAVDSSTWGAWKRFANVSDIPTTLPASDVSSWAKASTKPTYTASEVSLGNVTNESKETMFTSPTFTETATGNFIETCQALGTISTNTTVDCSNGSIATATLGGAITLGITASASTSTCRTLTLVLTNGGSAVITWSASIKWSDGVAPTLTASGVDILTFMTVDNGTTWYGALNGSAFA